jgi:hypothetical protein
MPLGNSAWKDPSKYKEKCKDLLKQRTSLQTCERHYCLIFWLQRYCECHEKGSGGWYRESIGVVDGRYHSLTGKKRLEIEQFSIWSSIVWFRVSANVICFKLHRHIDRNVLSYAFAAPWHWLTRLASYYVFKEIEPCLCFSSVFRKIDWQTSTSYQSTASRQRTSGGTHFTTNAYR